MSVKVIETVHHPEANGEVIELFGTEALVRRRKALQAKLGGLSVALNDASKAYNECILEIIETNTELTAAADKDEDVDTQALARELQAGMKHPAIL